jgi:hypothetical protein
LLAFVNITPRVGPNPVILIDLTWEFGEKTIGGGKFGPNMELN